MAGRRRRLRPARRDRTIASETTTGSAVARGTLAAISSSRMSSPVRASVSIWRKPACAYRSAGGHVLGRDQQADAAAAIDMMQPVQDSAHDGAAIAPALLAAVQGERTQPPAGCVAGAWMHDVEADDGVIDLDRDHGMGRAAAYGSQNILDRAKKAFNLLWVEIEGRNHMQLVMGKSSVSQGHNAPNTGHEILCVYGKRELPRGSLSRRSLYSYPISRRRGYYPRDNFRSCL